MGTVTADGPLLEQAAREQAHQVVETPREADAWLLEGRGAWDRLRSLRAQGLRTGAVVLTEGPPPMDRPRLEPVVLLRDVADLEQSLERLEESARAGQVPLAIGLVDLDRAVFHRHDGQAIRLSTIEWRLLGYLGTRAGRVVPRDELQLQVWDHRRAVPTRAVDMAVSRLRGKIEEDPSQPVSLLTVRHVGYRLILHELPELPDGFVGRRSEVRSIRRRARTGVVLVCGPPGIGKSRTAAVAARGLGPMIRVHLEGVHTLAGAVAALGLAADVHLDEADPAVAIQTVFDALTPGTAVLWDDADGVEGLLAILDGATHQIVTQRREVDGLACEVLRPLDRTASAELLGVEGADGLLDVLDGIPLSIELAAARLPLLGVDALITSLARPLAVLQGPAGSMRATIASSWSRATDASRRMFVHVAWFNGTFRVADAFEIAGEDVDAWLGLVESHLVHREGARFRVLHAIRSFVREKSDDVARTTWLAWLVEHAGRHTRALETFESRTAFEWLALHHADVVAGRQLALERADHHSLAALTLAMDGVLQVRASAVERRRLLEESLAVLQGTPHEAAVRLAHGDLLRMSDWAIAMEDYEQVLRCAEPDLRVRAGIEASMRDHWTGGIEASRARLQGLDLEGATWPVRLYHEAAIARTDDFAGRVDIETTTSRLQSIHRELVNHGALDLAVWTGVEAASRLAVTSPERARDLARENLALADQLVSPVRRGEVRLQLAKALADCGELDEALELFGEVEAIFRTIRKIRIFQLMDARSTVLLSFAQHDDARRGWLECHAWAVRAARVGVEANAVLCLACLETDAGAAEAAARWAAAGLEVAERLGSPHLSAHAWLAMATAHRLTGVEEQAGEAFDRIDVTALSAVGMAECHALEASLWEDRVERCRERAVLPAVDHRSEERSRLVHAAMHGEVEQVERWTVGESSTRLGYAFRLEAKLWRLTALRRAGSGR